ncbi:MAG: histidine kinase [Treponema sp.]|jgi:two-component system sensor histidine kinase YesM|nr:histidine kinase [Treponema sp.]
MSRKTIFSKRFVMVYTLIAALPFGILIMVTAEQFYAEQEYKLIDDAEQSLADNAGYVYGCIESMYKIESSIVGNTDLAHFFLFADKTDPLPVILQLRLFTNELERLPLIMPQLYGVRLFITNSGIPERWPIFFHERRLAPLLPLTQTWRYNYRIESTHTFEIDRSAMAAYTQELRFNRRQVGYIQILMRMRDFFPFLYKNDASGDVQDFVFYRNESLAGGAITEFEQIIRAYISQEMDSGKSAGVLRIQEMGKPYLLVWRQVPHSELVLVRDCGAARFRKSFIFFRTATAAGVIGSILVLFLIIRFVTQKMMHRLYAVIEGMKRVREGTLGTQLPVDGNDEITDMALTFNSMTVRLIELIEKIKSEQQLVTDTEIKAMQNQINAHFLYNVLETIKMQAEVADQQDIVQSITLLGKIMHYCLRRNDRLVPLSEELEYVRSYIALLNIRNDYVIRLNIGVGEPYLSCRIPKMLIQPLVENAFWYAIEPFGIDAEIGITAQYQDGLVWLEVQDYGRGMDQKTLEKIHTLLSGEEELGNKNSIGIQNIQQRLTAFYGDSWKLQIISSEGIGTRVRVPIAQDRSFEKNRGDGCR